MALSDATLGFSSKVVQCKSFRELHLSLDYRHRRALGSVLSFATTASRNPIPIPKSSARISRRSENSSPKALGCGRCIDPISSPSMNFSEITTDALVKTQYELADMMIANVKKRPALAVILNEAIFDLVSEILRRRRREREMTSQTEH
jgi:hypothetical protein